MHVKKEKQNIINLMSLHQIQFVVLLTGFLSGCSVTNVGFSYFTNVSSDGIIISAIFQDKSQHFTRINTQKI